MQKTLARLLGLPIFFFVLLVGTGLFAQVSFTVSPAILELTVPAGSTREFSLTVFVTSGEKKEAHFRVYATDFRLERDGSIEFFRADTLGRSAAPWIEISPSELVMKPEGRKQIKVKLTIPARALGGYYAAIMVELVPEVPPEAVMGVVRTWRMASIVFDFYYHHREQREYTRQGRREFNYNDRRGRETGRASFKRGKGNGFSREYAGF